MIKEDLEEYIGYIVTITVRDGEIIGGEIISVNDSVLNLQQLRGARHPRIISLHTIENFRIRGLKSQE